MKLRIFLVFLPIFFILPKTAYAEKVAASSAMLKIDPSLIKKEDMRVKQLQAYFDKYDSPLINEAETFIKTADQYGLDYRLLPAIAGVESGFGKLIPYNSYNGWGWGIYGTNVTYFTSWKEAIKTIAKELKEKYMDTWGAKDVYAIGNYYASDPAWASKVTYYMNDIANFTPDSGSKAISISI